MAKKTRRKRRTALSRRPLPKDRKPAPKKIKPIVCNGCGAQVEFRYPATVAHCNKCAPANSPFPGDTGFKENRNA